MWTLFPELLGPIVAAFVFGSLVAWAVLGLLLPKMPDERPDASSPPGGKTR